VNKRFIDLAACSGSKSQFNYYCY